jgi:hypothetical protein
MKIFWCVLDIICCSIIKFINLFHFKKQTKIETKLLHFIVYVIRERY